MKLKFYNTATELLDCDVLIVGYTEEERPLRGIAGLIDWRLNGFLSKQIQNGALNGANNESTLVPCEGRIKPGKLLVIGLGSGLEITRKAMNQYGARLFKHAASLNLSSYAVPCPHAFGTPPVNLHCLEEILKGISSAASKHKDTAFLERACFYFQSDINEEIDLAAAVIPRLLSKHSLSYGAHK